MQSPFKQPRPGSDAKEGNARLCLMLIVCVGVIELGHNYMFFSRTGSKYMPLQLAPELLSRPGISRSDVGGYDHIGGKWPARLERCPVYKEYRLNPPFQSRLCTFTCLLLTRHVQLTFMTLYLLFQVSRAFKLLRQRCTSHKGTHF